MNVYFISVTFMYVILDFIVLLQCTTSTYAVPTADQQKPSASNDLTPAMYKWEMNPGLKPLWVYRPPPIQSQPTDEQLAHHVVLRSPHLLTKLAKPFSYGIDSVFPKPYFEPFERRPKPVTLVAFRKNGILPRISADLTNPMSSEVAELQSPFNDISNLWQDDSLLFKL